MNRIKYISIIALTVFMSALFVKASYFSAAPNDIVTVKGEFTSITRPDVTLKDNSGTEYKIHLGPYWYWDDNGYSVSLSAETEIYGKLASGTNEIYAYTITQNGKTIKLVDDNNNPLWWNSGKGRGDGNGWGMGNKNCPGYGSQGRCGRWMQK